MSGTILIVEDEQALADAYAHWLENEFEVVVANDGEGAIECLGPEIDVILLDRRLPGRSGDEVLEAVNRRYPECRVAMISAIDPDFDIIEMEFDDYVVKPIKRDELRSTIDRLLHLSDYDDQTRRLYAYLAKRDALEGVKSGTELDRSRAYQDFLRRIERLKSQVCSTGTEGNGGSSGSLELPWE